MKNFFAGLLIIVLFMVPQSCTDANAVVSAEIKSTSVPETAPSYLETLKEAGFERIALVSSERNRLYRMQYKASTGLNFLGNDEVEAILKDQNLMIAETRFFIGHIPQTALDALQVNLRNYKASSAYTSGFVYDNQFYSDEWMEKEGPKYAITTYVRLDGRRIGGMFIVGPANQFDVEAINEENANRNGEDPIILISVEDGFLELARW